MGIFKELNPDALKDTLDRLMGKQYALVVYRPEQEYRCDSVHQVHGDRTLQEILNLCVKYLIEEEFTDGYGYEFTFLENSKIVSFVDDICLLGKAQAMASPLIEKRRKNTRKNPYTGEYETLHPDQEQESF